MCDPTREWHRESAFLGRRTARSRSLFRAGTQTRVNAAADQTMTTVTFPRGNKDAWASVSEPATGVWVLEMHNLPDNRLEPVRRRFFREDAVRDRRANINSLAPPL